VKDIQNQLQKLGPPDQKTQQAMMQCMSKFGEAMMKLPDDPEVHQVLDSMR